MRKTTYFFPTKHIFIIPTKQVTIFIIPTKQGIMY